MSIRFEPSHVPLFQTTISGDEGIRQCAEAEMCSAAGEFHKAIELTLKIAHLPDRAKVLIQIIKDIRTAGTDIREFPAIFSELAEVSFSQWDLGNISFELAMSLVAIKEYEDAIKIGMNDTSNYTRSSALTKIAQIVIRDRVIDCSLNIDFPCLNWVRTLFFQICNQVSATEVDDDIMDSIVSYIKRNSPDGAESVLRDMVVRCERLSKFGQIDAQILELFFAALRRSGYDRLM